MINRYLSYGLVIFIPFFNGVQGKSKMRIFSLPLNTRFKILNFLGGGEIIHGHKQKFTMEESLNEEVQKELVMKNLFNNDNRAEIMQQITQQVTQIQNLSHLSKDQLCNTLVNIKFGNEMRYYLYDNYLFFAMKLNCYAYDSFLEKFGISMDIGSTIDLNKKYACKISLGICENLFQEKMNLIGHEKQNEQEILYDISENTLGNQISIKVGLILRLFKREILFNLGLNFHFMRSIFVTGLQFILNDIIKIHNETKNEPITLNKITSQWSNFPRSLNGEILYC